MIQDKNEAREGLKLIFEKKKITFNFTLFKFFKTCVFHRKYLGTWVLLVPNFCTHIFHSSFAFLHT